MLFINIPHIFRCVEWYINEFSAHRQLEGKLKDVKAKKSTYSPESSRSGKIPTTVTRKELQYRSAKETRPLDIKVDRAVGLAKAKRGCR